MHLVAPGAQVMLSLIFTAFEQDSRFHHPLSADAPGAVGVSRLAWWLVEWVQQARRGRPASQRPCPMPSVSLTPVNFIDYLSYMIFT